MAREVSLVIGTRDRALSWYESFSQLSPEAQVTVDLIESDLYGYSVRDFGGSDENCVYILESPNCCRAHGADGPCLCYVYHQVRQQWYRWTPQHGMYLT